MRRVLRRPVLIVEDNPDTREILQRVLAIRGHPSITADDGLEALAILKRGEPVSVIILDLHLPGMDGRSFVRELQADPTLSAIPVVTYSADRAEVPGVAAQVRKGVDDPGVLLAVVEKFALAE